MERMIKLFSTELEDLHKQVNEMETMVDFIMEKRGYEIMDTVEDIKYALREIRFVIMIK
jgi:cupin superfamily acireductone dioxygenase involved in methionine salvage